MILVEICEDEQGMITGYTVSGHSGYADEGSDIICSAISALTQAPLHGMTKHLKIKPSWRVNQEDGYLKVALDSAPTELTEAILRTMVLGVESIVRQCPEYVRIQEHRR